MRPSIGVISFTLGLPLRLNLYHKFQRLLWSRQNFYLPACLFEQMQYSGALGTVTLLTFLQNLGTLCPRAIKTNVVESIFKLCLPPCLEVIDLLMVNFHLLFKSQFLLYFLLQESILTSSSLSQLTPPKCLCSTLWNIYFYNILSFFICLTSPLI